MACSDEKSRRRISLRFYSKMAKEGTRKVFSKDGVDSGSRMREVDTYQAKQ